MSAAKRRPRASRAREAEIDARLDALGERLEAIKREMHDLSVRMQERARIFRALDRR